MILRHTTKSLEFSETLFFDQLSLWLSAMVGPQKQPLAVALFVEQALNLQTLVQICS